MLKQGGDSTAQIAEEISRTLASVEQAAAKHADVLDLTDRKVERLGEAVTALAAERVQPILDTQKKMAEKLAILDEVEQRAESIQSVVDVLRAIKINTQY